MKIIIYWYLFLLFIVQLNTAMFENFLCRYFLEKIKGFSGILSTSFINRLKIKTMRNDTLERKKLKCFLAKFKGYVYFFCHGYSFFFIKWLFVYY